MLNALRAYRKMPTTMIGIVTAMMFQIIFSLVWMTGYDGMMDNTKQLKIAIVNEDSAGMGKQIAERLGSNLPFQLKTEDVYANAKEQLNNREVQMVLHIPADFSKQLQNSGQKAQIDYTINESNPAMIKSMMQSVANGITETVNKEAAAAGAQVILTQTAQIPAQQAQGIAQGMAEKVKGNLEYVNPVKGMANQMIPMMMVLASFVGAMIMGMNLQQSTMHLPASIGKWNKFAARVVINIGSSLIISLIGSSLITLLGGQSAGGFIAMWLFQALFLLSFMFFSQLSLIAFGMAGMLVNIVMLSVQLVSSGAMMPRELLSGFYLTLSNYLPATYAVKGLMNILFGGPSASGDAAALAIITGVCVILAMIVVGLRKDLKASAPTLSPLESAPQS
jgi:YhgE/Pip-like protein